MDERHRKAVLAMLVDPRRRVRRVLGVCAARDERLGSDGAAARCDRVLERGDDEELEWYWLTSKVE